MMLVVSTWGTAAPLVRRMHRDGFDVTLYISNPFSRSVRLFEGLCPQVPTWADAMDVLRTPGSTAIFDNTGSGRLAQQLGLSVPVWGASPLADLLEHDRGEFMRLLFSCGIRIPETILFHPERPSSGTRGESFRSVKGHVREALHIVPDLSGAWMVKPYSGTSAQTYKAENADDLRDHLLDMGKQPQSASDPFLLQKVIPGVELSTEIWVHHGEIIPGTANATIETKRFYPGDLGPNTGSETSTVWPYGAREPKILRETMGSGAFRAWLRRPVFLGIPYPPFTGPLDVNCIISDADRKPYAIEATPRMGWSAYIALAEILEDGTLWTVFDAAARGRLSGLPCRANYGYCVKLSTPPYPVSDEFGPEKRLGTFYHDLLSLCRGNEVGGPVESPHVWFRDARLSKAGKVEIAGLDGSVADIGGAGRTITEARDSAHQLFDQMIVSNKQGRTIDGADHAIRDTGKLQTWGYEIPE